MAIFLHALMPLWPRTVRLLSYVLDWMEGAVTLGKIFPLGQISEHASGEKSLSPPEVCFPNADPRSRVHFWEVLAGGSCGAGVRDLAMDKTSWSADLSCSLHKLRCQDLEGSDISLVLLASS